MTKTFTTNIFFLCVIKQMLRVSWELGKKGGRQHEKVPWVRGRVAEHPEDKLG